MGMRVYELAKKLGMENKALLPELKKMGIAVSSHSSALDEEAVQKVLSKFLPGTSTAEKEGVAGRGIQGARVGQTRAGTSKSQRGEQAAKPDKKRILIKRKKEEEPVVPLTPVPAVEAEPAVAVAPMPSEAVTPAVSAVTPAVEGDTAPAVEAAATGEGDAASISLTAPASITPPTSVPPATEGASVQTPVVVTPTVSATVEQPAGKKKGTGSESGEAEAQRDKGKKTRKPGRVKDDEHDVKFREDAARWQDLRTIPVQRRDDRSRHLHHSTITEITKPRKKSVKVFPGMTVKEFAEVIGQRPADIVRKLMELGHMLTFNQPMNLDAAS
ncbi:MAG: translation initiation factor IF-2 N-terminal domain-containing protein, partial [Nitrospira sp.]|nr:translation initiation factor IF-2 N-terminal domain-containing protein [Nitrospira sp.]